MSSIDSAAPIVYDDEDWGWASNERWQLRSQLKMTPLQRLEALEGLIDFVIAAGMWPRALEQREAERWGGAVDPAA